MKTTILLNRHFQDTVQSLSTCTILSDNNNPLFASIALERGWNNNSPNISCIPVGVYKVVLEWSHKYQKMLWEIKGVDGRSECKFHSANYWWDLKGCIALGRRPKYLNSDRYLDVTDSRNTMKDFHRALKGFTEVTLIIIADENIC